ncbi:hypothetical protein ElyMa_003418100 [Elysia marginata]|uniref:Uncharacterized protein n=1 Tax=Elysia marginata TaxID=1093978 RepID=A0AAV4JQG7_9GAST|nr:hypothetical protein ElyMa_003418100 [Elysia marginata]
MRKQAGKQSGKQTKKAAAAAAAAAVSAVCETKPNAGSKTNKARRGVTTLAASLVDTADGTATAAIADTGVSGASPAKRARPGRENKKRNAKPKSKGNSNSISTSVSDVAADRNDEAAALTLINGGDQVVSSKSVPIKSEILQADTFVHVKSEIRQAEYLEKLKQDQLRQQQEQEQNQSLQQHVQHEAHSSEYEGVETSIRHHQQHFQQHEQQQQQVLYTYQDNGPTLIESVPASAAPPGSTLVHSIQTSLPSVSSPSQRPSSVPEPEQGRSPLPFQHHQQQHHHQQQSQQDQQYPPSSLASQQQQYQHYPQHDNFPQDHHQQQNNLQQQHLQQHQDLMHGAALENDSKDSPPPLLMPESSYVSTTSHPILMSGSTTTHLVQSVGHDEAGGLIYTHQPQQDHHHQQHQQHINSHHQLLYEAAIQQQQRNEAGNISDLHLEAQLQPPIAHSRGDSNLLHQGLGNSHNRLSNIHIPASPMGGLSGHQESGNLQGMDSASPGPAQMPSIDHQQMAQQLADMAHPHQTFTMLTNVSSLGGAPSPGIGNKRGGRFSNSLPF